MKVESGYRVVLRGAVVDLGAYRIVRGRRTIKLTAAEGELLTLLLANPNRLVRAEDLVAALHPKAPFDAARDRVRFTVTSLRTKLGRARRCLETVHGRGYLLSLDIDAPSKKGRGR